MGGQELHILSGMISNVIAILNRKYCNFIRDWHDRYDVLVY